MIRNPFFASVARRRAPLQATSTAAPPTSSFGNTASVGSPDPEDVPPPYDPIEDGPFGRDHPWTRQAKGLPVHVPGPVPPYDPMKDGPFGRNHPWTKQAKTGVDENGNPLPDLGGGNNPTPETPPNNGVGIFGYAGRSPNGPTDTFWNPTAEARAFYGNLLGNDWLGRYSNMWNAETSGGFEQMSETMRNDIRAALSKRLGKEVPYHLAMYDFNLGRSSPQRQPFQLANWARGGSQFNWYPGMDYVNDDYTQEAYDLWNSFLRDQLGMEP